MLDRFDELADGLNHPEGVAWNPFDGLIYAGGEGGELYAVTLDGEVELRGSTGWLDARHRRRRGGTGLRVRCRTRRDHPDGPDDGGRGACTRAASTTRTWTRRTSLRSAPTACSTSRARARTIAPRSCGSAPGGRTERWTTAVPRYPNGCLVTPDGSALVVVEAKAQRVVRVPILEDGSAGAPEVVAELPDTDADGISLAADGSYWVTLYRPDGLVRITPDGTVTTVVDDHLATHLDAPTNIAWVGEALDRAVVANVGGRFLSIADVGVAGHPLHYPEVP